MHTPPSGSEERRTIDPQREDLSLRDHALRSVSSNRFGHNPDTRQEDVDVAQISGGDDFRGEVQRILREFTVEQIVFLRTLERDYKDSMVRLSARYESYKVGMPTWDEVQSKLTPDILEKGLLMKKLGLKPAIVVVPPKTRQEILDDIGGEEHLNSPFYTPVFIHDIDDDNLWNDGHPAEPPQTWEIHLSTFVKNVPQDKVINATHRQNRGRVPALIRKYADYGLDVVRTASHAAAMHMKVLASGSSRKLDEPFSPVVLNGSVLQGNPEQLMALVDWSYDHGGMLTFRIDSQSNISDSHTVRPSVRIA